MLAFTSQPATYVGRFAPSPSGPLHLGSLTCALASYLDAKAHGGEWLLRIEDIDPPREAPGASDSIISCLRAHHLLWDRDILYQSTRSAAYLQALNHLRRLGLSYFCLCTRKTLSSLGGVYKGHCRNLNYTSGAQRLNIAAVERQGLDVDITFDDAIKGPQHQKLSNYGDCIIHRKDGLFAYQLAVVVDDIHQGITHVIRGDDLLDMTCYQHTLFRLLNAQPPQYGHIAVLVDSQGLKLSKQNSAPALDNSKAIDNIRLALQALHLMPPPQGLTLDELLDWATQQWRLYREKRRHSL